MIFYLLVSPITNPVLPHLQGKTQDDAPALFAALISGIIGLLLFGATLWAFIQLIQGGLNWISSGGDKSNLESAQKRITNALIGLFILFASWGLFGLVLNFLGMTSGGSVLNFILPVLH